MDSPPPPRRIDDAWWQAALDPAASAGQHLPAGVPPTDQPVERMTALLRAWAVGFATVRDDVAGPDLALGSRGLHPDECAAFLRALDARQVHADSAGYVVPLAARAKAVGGRYALCCKSGAGVTINTEYLVQLGAVGELLTSWRWGGTDLQVEMTEFDIVGFAPDDRIVLAVEAKARVTGPDSLEQLLRSLLRLADADPPQASGNAERKYLQLLRFCEHSPVVLWLIAAGARWPFLTVREDDRLTFTPIDDITRDNVLELTRAA